MSRTPRPMSAPMGNRTPNTFGSVRQMRVPKAITEDDLVMPFKHTSNAEVTWVIGMDGSRLAFRCLRLASMMMTLRGKHDLLVLHLSDEKAERESMLLESKCQEEARKCGIPYRNFAFKTLTRPAGWSVAQTLIYFANQCAGYRARLVIGAQGVRLDDEKGDRAMDWLGAVATECMAKVKVPLVVVKQPWGNVQGERNPLGRVLRYGRNGTNGLKIVVCVDSTMLSMQVFSFAAGLLRPDDRLVALYVAGTNKNRVVGDQADAMVRSTYTAECAKIEFSVKGIQSAEFMAVPHNHNGKKSIGSDILEATENAEADLLFMGSVELSNPERKHQLGSICAWVAKYTTSHLCIIKNVSLQS